MKIGSGIGSKETSTKEIEKFELEEEKSSVGDKGDVEIFCVLSCLRWERRVVVA